MQGLGGLHNIPAVADKSTEWPKRTGAIVSIMERLALLC